jgi:HD-GYP domain-containing protein (c-di-GMP phosphodiesterase class II)
VESSHDLLALSPRTHPSKGAEIAETVSALGPIVPIIRHHHESWDGKGYPGGLKAESISRLARVVAVADALDERVAGLGRPPLSFEQALREIEKEAGRSFDPSAVAALMRVRQ